MLEIYLPIVQVNIDIFLLLFLSLVVGVLSGLFGVGGGFLMTPFLIFMGIPPVYAVPNEVELGKQWANNKLLTSLSEKQVFLGTIRRGQYITVLYKQTSNTQPGEFLGRLVLGEEDNLIKIFGATIY